MKNGRVASYMSAVLALALCGCSVDVDRDEALLRVLVSGTSAEASHIALQVESVDGGGSYFEQFDLAAIVDRQLPDISAPTGLARVTATTVDSMGFDLDGPVVEEVLLRPGANGLELDFTRSQESVEPGGGQALTTVVLSIDLVSGPEFGTWRVEIPVDGAVWSAALTRLRTALGTAPSSLTLRHVDITVLPGADGDDSPELDDLWEASVGVQMVGMGVVAVDAGMFTAGEFSATQLSSTAELTPWLTLPADARVLLEGAVESGGPSLPVRLDVELELLGQS